MVFMHGERYIIRSVFDGAVFDAKMQKNDGAKVITWNWSGRPHQIWIAKSAMGKIGFLGGAFRLCTATHVIDDLKVLDQGLGSRKLLIWSFQGTSNQLWNAFPVSNNHEMYFIQNQGSGLVARNMGLGSQLQCAPLDEHDPKVHWRITPVDSFTSSAM